MQTASSLALKRDPSCRPAPAAISPRGSEAAAMVLTVGSAHTGKLKPSTLASRPELVAMMRGLRTSSRPKCRLACRAMGQTAPMLYMGTQKPISMAMYKPPSAPASRVARARPTKELKRKATCVLPACSWALMCRPIQGSLGRAYDSAIPLKPMDRPAAISPEAASKSSGLLMML